MKYITGIMEKNTFQFKYLTRLLQNRHIVKESNISLNSYWFSAGVFPYRACLCILSSVIAPFMPRQILFICTSFLLATGGLLVETISYFSKLSWYNEKQDTPPGLLWLPDFTQVMTNAIIDMLSLINQYNILICLAKSSFSSGKLIFLEVWRLQK